MALARSAEQLGYRRIWYAEHHNMATIASSAPAVLIAHIANQTSSIILGAGGVMLPNHSPLVIAEQFGTLATLFPGRIELGLGRAPGSDQVTMRALRRGVQHADQFPDDVIELMGYLSGDSRVPGVEAVPGAGTNVPLYILGSSLFGAQLAAALGLPYAFASHFAPGALQEAVAVYRARFRPSPTLERPQVLASVNLIVADTEYEAERQYLVTARERIRFFLTRDRGLDDQQVDRIMQTPQGRQVLRMLHYRVVGTARTALEQLEEFRRHADADELIISPAATTIDERLEAVERVAAVISERVA